MNEQHITLDVSKAFVQNQHVTLGQGDKGGTTIVATVYDNGAQLDLSGMDAYFEMRLPGGAEFVEDARCETSGNVIRYVVDEEHVCHRHGVTSDAYFELRMGDEVIASTGRFTVTVLQSASDGLTPAQAWSSLVQDLIDVKRGPAGPAGTSVSHQWDGTTLTVTSASGTSSANLVGPQGPQGPQGEPGSVDNLPVADADTLGCVKVGEGLSVDESGVLATDLTADSLPVASSDEQGVVMVGSYLYMDGSSLNVDRASLASDLCGQGLFVSEGTDNLSVNMSSLTYDGYAVRVNDYGVFDLDWPVVTGQLVYGAGYLKQGDSLEGLDVDRDSLFNAVTWGGGPIKYDEGGPSLYFDTSMFNDTSNALVSNDHGTLDVSASKLVEIIDGESESLTQANNGNIEVNPSAFVDDHTIHSEDGMLCVDTGNVADSIADLSTIEVVDSRICVSASGIADGVTIKANEDNNTIYVDASELVDNQTIKVNANGKLYVDVEYIRQQLGL